MTLRTRRMRGGLALLAAGVLLLSSCDRRGQEAIGFVEDRAELLSDVAEASITNWHAALLAQYDIDYRVLTTMAPSEDLGALAVQRFEDAGVGKLSSTGRGLLLVVDAEGERVRLEVARELEGAFPDSFVAFIEREQMAPFFAAGRAGDGIVAASELIAGRAEEAIETAALNERAAAASSAGAGAESRAKVGGGYERPTAVLTTDTQAQVSPIDTVTAYLDAMTARNGSAHLDLYTPGTRQMLAGHVATRGQMDNLVRTYRSCPQARVREQGDFAVVDYLGDSGRCSPWFLERSADGRWRLDLLTMQRAVRFDTRNHWRIVTPEALGEYAFAFER
jgi:uncharacterized protein